MKCFGAIALIPNKFEYLWHLILVIQAGLISGAALLYDIRKTDPNPILDSRLDPFSASHDFFV